jgi:hypothetical protein
MSHSRRSLLRSAAAAALVPPESIRPACSLVADLSAEGDVDAAEVQLREWRRAGRTSAVVAMLPFAYEGARARQEAVQALGRLEGYTTVLAVFEKQRLLGGQSPGERFATVMAEAAACHRALFGAAASAVDPGEFRRLGTVEFVARPDARGDRAVRAIAELSAFAARAPAWVEVHGAADAGLGEALRQDFPEADILFAPMVRSSRALVLIAGTTPHLGYGG